MSYGGGEASGEETMRHSHADVICTRPIAVEVELMEESAADARRPRPPSDVLQPHQHPTQTGCSAQQNPICP